MIKINNFLILIFITLFFFTQANSAIKNKIIYTVGNVPITFYDLLSEIKLINIISGKTLANENNEMIKKVALESLIRKSLKATEIKKYDFLTYQEKNLLKEISNISQKINLSKKELKKLLESNNVSFSLLSNRIIIDLKWNSLMFDIYKNKVTINEMYISDQLELLKNNQFINEYLLSEIVLAPVTSDKLESEVKMIKEKIKLDGFDAVALKASISDSAKYNGNLGWISETKISKKFLTEIKKTSIGSLTNAILLPEGIVIMKINEKRTKENKLDLETAKKQLIEGEKNKSLETFSILHLKKLRMNTLIQKR